MAKINRKRFEWYIKKNLAKQINDNTIQLTFTPKGLGNANDQFYLAEMKNICVACGTGDNYTKHHVIPHEYRKWFPVEWKSSSSHDVVLLCSECHEKYETEADKLKKKLCEQYNVPMSGSGKFRDERIASLQKLITALRKYKNIPQARQEEMKKQINTLLNKPVDDALNDQELDVIMQEEVTKEDSTGFQSHGKLLVEALVGPIDSEEYKKNAYKLEDFAIMWRRHFVDIMKPQFLSEHWNVERKMRDKK